MKVMSRKNYSINLREVTLCWKSMKALTHLRLLIWVVLGAVYLFGFAALINAVKWW